MRTAGRSFRWCSTAGRHRRAADRVDGMAPSALHVVAGANGWVGAAVAPGAPRADGAGARRRPPHRGAHAPEGVTEHERFQRRCPPSEGSGDCPDTRNATDAAPAQVGGLTTVLVRPSARGDEVTPGTTPTPTACRSGSDASSCSPPHRRGTKTTSRAPSGRRSAPASVGRTTHERRQGAHDVGALYVRHWREPVILCPRGETPHTHTTVDVPDEDRRSAVDVVAVGEAPPRRHPTRTLGRSSSVRHRRTGTGRRLRRGRCERRRAPQRPAGAPRERWNQAVGGANGAGRANAGGSPMGDRCVLARRHWVLWRISTWVARNLPSTACP